ncbi:MAG TPA: hypothetical protein VK590_01490 [Saprospiraceae bacterium]|nr:hypothetical protein [Saprospiraceae bacterium]
MKNSDDKNNVIKLPVRREIYELDNFEKEILELTKRLNEDLKNQEKNRRKMKALLYSLVTYIVTIIFVAIYSMLNPSFRPFADWYLTFCNVLGVGLCVWNGMSLFKSGLIKERTGKWLFVFAVFGILVNLFAVVDNFILGRFIL